MAEINKFSEIVGKTNVFLGKTCGIFYLTAIGLSVFEVFMRYVIDAPTSWTSETIMNLCAIAWLLSVGAVTQQRRHITVTVMEIIVGEKTWEIMKKVALLISMVSVGGLLWASWNPGIHALTAFERSGSAFNPPVPTVLKIMLVVACILYMAQLIANLIERRIQPQNQSREASRLTSEAGE